MEREHLEIIIPLFVLMVSIPIHEFAHARSAVSYGDDTPRIQGRLTILPWDHFDPLGAFMCIMTSITGFGLGWGKPVMVNPLNLRHPRWDGVKIAAWGPFSNLLLAIAFGLPLRFGWVDYGNPALWQIFVSFVYINLGLMMFNMIPIYPLDGSKVLAGFLPDHLADQYGAFMARFGPMLLILLILAGRNMGLLDMLIGEPTRTIGSWITGL